MTIFFIRTALRGGWEIKILVLNVDKDANKVNFDEFTYQVRVRILTIRIFYIQFFYSLNIFLETQLS